MALADRRAQRRAPLPGALEAGRRLRLSRLGAGLSQSQLARACGVSRQAVAGAEAGIWSPSLAVALRLARVLGTSVDRLFAPEPQVQELDVASLGPSSAGGRARVARVWERWVGLPLEGDRATLPGFLPSTGAIGPEAGRGLRWGSQRDLVAAGCDPALSLLAGPVGAAGEGWTLDWWPCASAEALRLLRQGLVHVAGVHRPVGEQRAPEAERDLACLGFARWREGLVFRPPPEPPVRSVADAVERRLRWANREPGAQARTLLDREVGGLGLEGSSLPGYGTEARGHLPLASLVASGAADVGVATEPAALAYRLAFLPLTDEQSLLLVPRPRLDTPELRLLLEVLASVWLRRELEALPGYDASILGEDLSPAGG